jgi:hypothetical protein
MQNDVILKTSHPLFTLSVNCLLIFKVMIKVVPKGEFDEIRYIEPGTER